MGMRGSPVRYSAAAHTARSRYTAPCARPPRALGMSRALRCCGRHGPRDICGREQGSAVTTIPSTHRGEWTRGTQEHPALTEHPKACNRALFMLLKCSCFWGGSLVRCPGQPPVLKWAWQAGPGWPPHSQISYSCQLFLLCSHRAWKSSACSLLYSPQPLPAVAWASCTWVDGLSSPAWAATAAHKDLERLIKLLVP